ncbi:MAG: bifunctional phosphoribosylaminoimidazolecarboxamide formyltransferase/IMP cyclohydrolase [Deltaproteobacteria bacterium]|nr:bifunctional phosphoribosylaminoimidazolecarboxamide formyltransferase/IMP cyclohydrolase [Deltaproteobacteria bacterium]
MRKVQRAIVSVTDKTGVLEFARELVAMGVEIISTGGTAEVLKKGGVTVIPISAYTGFPEMLDGRVKTLHPKIHGGILGVRDNEAHAREMENYGILPIDMVVVNLYAFEETVRKGKGFEEAVENIDIGGPTMIRAAAKNFRHVACVVNPADYPAIVREMREKDGAVSPETRFNLAKKAFQLTARYDGAVSNWLGALADDREGPARKFPDTFTSQFRKIQDLRYGENPHQQAAFYGSIPPVPATLSTAVKHHGKELSYNNILDLSSALELVREFHEPACVIIKHNNPCGAAMSKLGLMKALDLALACDGKSAFGGIVGFNGTVGAELAEKLGDIFLEAIVAPSFDEGALGILKEKKNLRIIEVEKERHKPLAGVEMKMVSGGTLIQTSDAESASDLKTVTERGPTDEELADLIFAWTVCKHVKSNAIIIAKGGATLGIGAGQMSRIDSTRIAVIKAGDAGLALKGSVLASDAFFPFRDNVELAAQSGITAIIQPGGSIRDEDVIKAANERGMAMVFTGMRHFRH